MTAGEQCHQTVVNDIGLSENDLGNLSACKSNPFAKPFNICDQFLGSGFRLRAAKAGIRLHECLSPEWVSNKMEACRPCHDQATPKSA